MNKNIEWLIETAGPIVRYRTLDELHQFDDIGDKKAAISELIACKEVQKWINLLQESKRLHGSDSYSMENSLAKLSAYGVRAKMDDLEDIMGQTYAGLKRIEADDHIIYPFFVSIGFSDGGRVEEYANKRLDAVYEFTESVYEKFNTDDTPDFLMSQKEKRDLHVPGKWKDKPVWKPELNTAVPNCYDFYMFAYMKGHDKKRAAVLRFINTPKFQKLCEIREFEGSYGWNPIKKYCWSTWGMPVFYGYSGFDTEKFLPSKFLMHLDIVSRYPNASEIEWFNNGLQYLEKYKLDNGHYMFPQEYLLDRPTGYYIYTGARMRLGEKGKDRVEIESTFRMEHMKKLQKNSC